MPDDSAQALRDAASTAHRYGDVDTAVAIYQTILDLFPDSPEALDAVFYLSSIGKCRRSAPKRAPVDVPGENTNAREEAPGNRRS